jgi:hypothetical protein
MKCSICATPGVRRYVDGVPEMTAAAVSREAAAIGMDLSADRILTHRKHLALEPPERGARERKTDFAARVRDRAAELFDTEKLDLTDKDHAPGINAGLKAQAILDAREKAKAKQGSAELAFAIIAMLTGNAATPMPTGPLRLELEDGDTIEGEAVELATD